MFISLAFTLKINIPKTAKIISGKNGWKTCKIIKNQLLAFLLWFLQFFFWKVGCNSVDLCNKRSFTRFEIHFTARQWFCIEHIVSYCLVPAMLHYVIFRIEWLEINLLDHSPRCFSHEKRHQRKQNTRMYLSLGLSFRR